jgi:hypothetical protein
MTLRGDPTTGGRFPSDHGDGAPHMRQRRMGDRTTKQLGQATAAAAEHEQLGLCGLLDERSAHVVVVADQLDLDLDLGEPVTFGLQRAEEMVALNRLHTVDPGHESRIAPHGRGPDPHGGQPDLPARRSLESKPDRLCRQMRAIHTYNDPSVSGPKIVAGGRVDHDEWARSMGRQGDAHRPFWKAGEAVGAAATHHEEFGAASLAE